jgi:hypothetical protein
MAWNRSETKTTKHSCGGPVFGRLTAGCPRCDELARGAEPVQWSQSRQQRNQLSAKEIRDHFRSEKHRRECGRVCTFGDW